MEPNLHLSLKAVHPLVAILVLLHVDAIIENRDCCPNAQQLPDFRQCHHLE